MSETDNEFMNPARLSRKLFPFTIAALTIMLAGSAKGQTGSYNGFGWEQIGNAIEITYYNGPGGAIAIPSTITNLPVTKIGNFAFAAGQFVQCPYLTSVTIPNTVTSIGENAFFGCSLTSVTIPNSVTYIGFQAFCSCTNLTSITIPNSITDIEIATFYDCTSLTTITIPDSVTSIGCAAFYGCTSLKTITIPKSVSALSVYVSGTGVSSGTFQDCTSLTSVTILGSSGIGQSTFDGCTNLTSVSIANVVTTIGELMFGDCTSLTNVTIPNSVTTIGDGAFMGCTSLNTFSIGHGVITIGANAFADCKLTSITIPSSVTNISAWAFCDCASLTNICFEGNQPSDGGGIFLSDAALSVIYYVNGTTGWGPTFSGVKTALCTQCGSPALTITGKVCCSCDTNPIAGALVTIGTYSTTTDSGGNYSISNVPPDTYTLTVTNAMYYPTNLTVTLAPGSITTAANVWITPNGTDPNEIIQLVYSGNVQLSPDSTGTATFDATYIPGPGLTLSTAACLLGFDHFNWLSKVLFDPDALLDFCIQPAFWDPPHLRCSQINQIPIDIVVNGILTSTIYEQADTLPFYYNEGAGYPGYFNVTNAITPDGTTLKFHDQPRDPNLPNGVAVAFETCLAGVNADGSKYTPFRWFQWTSTYTGKAGDVTVYLASLTYETGGNGQTTVTKTNVQPLDLSPASVALILQTGGSFPITIQPPFQTVVSGTDVTFAISPTNSSSPLNYQWRINGTNISGATNFTLQLLNVTTNDSGIYDAILSNTNGSIGSAPATLTVLVPTSESQFLFTTNNGTISITGYTGPGNAVVIPDTINGYPVTTIGDEAFYQHSNLTGITIPNSVTSIGESAFSDCWFLTSIMIPNSVTNIGAQAFYECIWLADVTIGTNVTSIGEGAFWECWKLANITIPNSVRSIGDMAFDDCYKLTSITIPSSVISIGDYAFSDCRALSAVTVDTLNLLYVSLNGVLFDSSQTTLIQYPAGKGGTSYTIPNSVTNIEGRAFYWCQSLTSITIPDSVTNIGVLAFSGCSNMTSVYFSGNAPSPSTNSSVFSGDSKTIVYYLPGTTGWGSTFDGRPTALWFLPNPEILNHSSSFGVQSNGFGFIISWATNISVVVEASTNLVNPIWSAVATNSLTGGSAYFSDPQWTNYQGRFYRIRSP